MYIDDLITMQDKMWNKSKVLCNIEDNPVILLWGKKSNKEANTKDQPQIETC